MRPTFLLILSAAVLSILLVGGPAVAAEFTMEEKDDGVSVFIDGKLFTRYITGDKVANKPYFYPVIGPTGKGMTRSYPMDEVEGEAKDHPHHRSFWFGHQFVNDFDTWHEELTLIERAKGDPEKLAAMKKKLGASIHREILEISAGKDGAVLKVSTDYTDPVGTVMASDVRTFSFHLGPDGSRVVDAEIVFTGAGESVVFSDAKDAGLSLRVAHSMSVEANEGGRIVTSEGRIDKDAWGSRSEWCDFNGPVGGERLGIAVMNHPSSFGFPTPWHARTYGLFTANPFGLSSVAGEKGDGSVTLRKGQSISTKHRIIFHAGDEKEADIAGAWKRYSSMK